MHQPAARRRRNLFTGSALAALVLLPLTSAGCFVDGPAEEEETAETSEAALGVAAAFQNGVSPNAGYSGARDTMLEENAPSTARGRADGVSVDRDYPSGSGKSATGLLRFDLRSIPVGSKVEAVKLTVRVTNATSGSGYALYAVRRAWSEMEATWGRASAGVAWGAPGARSASDRSSTALGTMLPTGLGAYTVTLNAAGVATVQEWINEPSKNFGFVIDASSNSDGMRFTSSNGTVAATRPRLAVTYGSAGAVASCPTSRDAGVWPFSSTSPWNRPLGSGAAFVAAASPEFSVLGGAALNVATWSHPVTFATSSDPVRTITRRGTVCATTNVPAAAAPDAEADGHMHIIDPTRRRVVEMFGARRLANGNVETRACVVNDLRDEGVYPTWHGVRAYGGSAIGGLIRRGELVRGIPHALAVGVRRAAMNMKTPNGKAFVWPASAADRDWATTYGTTGNVHMGSLLAIPPGVDVTKLGLSEVGLRVARAAQDYGVYVVDAANANVVFYAEPAASSEVPSTLRSELGTIVTKLQVVRNNAPGATAGGGTARACVAPALR